MNGLEVEKDLVGLCFATEDKRSGYACVSGETETRIPLMLLCEMGKEEDK